MKRYEWIDIIRGLCILAIVACHTVKESFNLVPGLQEFLTMFMINTFFLLSGFLSKTEAKSVKEIVRGKWKTIVVPYLVYSSLFIVIDTIQVLTGDRAVKDLLSDCYKTLVLSGIGTLWFLPVILGVQILYQRLVLGSQKEKCVYYMGLFASIVYVILHQQQTNESLLTMIVNAPLITAAKVFISSLFFLVGVYMKKVFMPNVRKPNLLIGISILFLAFLAGRNMSGYDYNRLIIPNLVLYILISLFCCISVVYFGAAVFYSMGYKWGGIQWFGRHSLTVMCTHYSLLLPLIRNLISGIIGGGGAYLTPYDMIALLVIVVLEIPIVLLVTKARERYFQNP